MNKKTKLFSFDIFDTCFIRTCGDPINVIYLLAKKVLGENTDFSMINDFVLIRRKGEECARKILTNKQKEEITLKEIYQFCNFHNLTELDNDSIMQNELEIEDEVLLPIYETKKRIEQLHIKGDTIAYISDMYLPKEFIIKKLKDYNYYVDEKLVFVSSDIKKTKESGNLFRYIQKELIIEYNNWRHIGDNKLSDYKIPKELGIRAKLVKFDYNIYEKKAINLCLDDGDLFNSYPYSLCRALRLSNQNNPQLLFASEFIAPIFVPYTYYILCDARDRGIEHLYFIARDGYILYLIAQLFISHFPNIQLHYLYASRKSLYLPGIEQLSYDTIKDIVPLDKGIQGILYALQMEDFDYSHLAITGLSCLEILKLLLEDKTFVENLNKQYNEQCDLCARYFIQEGLSYAKCAIVDVLGSRRCHQFINSILRRNHMPEVFAYYYEVTHQRIIDSSKYSSMNFQERNIHSKTYHHVSQPLCEQYFCITNQQRTIGYKNINNTIEPIFEEDPINNLYKEKIFNANKMILLAYATHFIKHPVTNPVLCIKRTQLCLNMFYHNPQKEYLEAFNGFFCTDGNTKYELLQKKKLIYTIFRHNMFFRWKEGNIVYNSGRLYRLIRAFLAMRIYILCRK